eukprot:15439118-Alexandrium_andersonii.AAC.1
MGRRTTSSNHLFAEIATRPTLHMKEAAVPAGPQGKAPLLGAWKEQNTGSPSIAALGGGGAARSAATPVIAAEPRSPRLSADSKIKTGRFALQACRFRS